MSEFLSIASHELRTPVTVIKTNIEMLTRRAERAMTAEAAQDSALARQLYMLQLTGRQVQRLTRLIADLLDITRMREGRFELCPELVDVAEITREAVESQRLAHPQRLIRLLLPEAATALVRADADRICQAVENYVTNALKYSPPSAPVSVTVRVIDRHCRVSVSDRGQSIPREEQEHIWELFHRAAGVKVQSGSGIGVGIGLYITRAIIERSGGRVGVRSVPGKGSTFWFTLPLATDAAES